MRNRTSTVFLKGAALSALALCLSVMPAKAGSCAGTVFLWAVNGSTLEGLDCNASVVTSTAAPTGENFFSVAVAGSSNSQNIFVADSAAHTLYEYNWTISGQTGTLTKNSTTFSFASDLSGGGISHQEIALDGSGNLWTTSFDGQVEEYSSNCTSPCSGTPILAPGSAVTGARGIMVYNGNVYVNVEGGYGSGYLDYFAAGTTTPIQNPTVNRYATLGAATTGTSTPQGTGQMRGVTADSLGNIYYVDSTWGAAGTNNGYVCNAGTTAGTTCTYAALASQYQGLNGPNEIISGSGTSNGSGAFGAGCDVLYVAQYYAGSITEIGTGNKLTGSNSACGSLSVQTFVAAGGLPQVSGLSLAPSNGLIGGNLGPTGLFGPEFQPASAPEPGTWVLMISAILGVAGAQVWRRRHAAQA